LTVSVLPVDRLPYRPLEGYRLEAYLDAQAGIRSGPDPPPGVLEAGCLRRAWTRFQTRVSTLTEAFGLLLPSVLSRAAHLWKQMRLEPWSPAQCAQYLNNGLSAAGLSAAVLEPAAGQLLASASAGLPRSLCLLARAAWIAAATSQACKITPDHVQSALQQVPCVPGLMAATPAAET
jgi:hypothetical protein